VSHEAETEPVKYLLLYRWAAVRSTFEIQRCRHDSVSMLTVSTATVLTGCPTCPAKQCKESAPVETLSRRSQLRSRTLCLLTCGLLLAQPCTLLS
jgi:hypothetical protein